MLRLFTLVLLMGTLLLAATSKQELDRAKKNLYSSSKSSQFKAYDTYKRYYIKALVNGDLKIQKRCLEGICIAGKKLRIDVDDYEKKLKKLKSQTKQKIVSVPKKRDVIKKEHLKQEHTSKTKNVKIRSQHALQDFHWQGSTLVLSFDFDLRSKDVNFFKLKPTKKKGYRYVFDINALLLKKPKIFHKEIQRISISQYKQKKLRLVIESKKRLNMRFKRHGHDLEISMGISKVSAPKAKKIVRSHNYNKLIIIDPGHGGRDGGAVGYQRHLEKDIVLQVSKRLAKILKEDGYKVRMTRDRDKTLSLKYRTKFTRKNKPDLFISIHANSVPKKNAHKAKGIEIYYLDPKRGSQRSSRLERKENAADYNAMNSTITKLFSATQSRAKVIESNFLAIDMGQNVVTHLRDSNFKVKQAKVAGGNFWVLVGATSAAVLVEVGFVSHPKEVQLLINKKYQQSFAEGLADGVDQYFRNKARR